MWRSIAALILAIPATVTLAQSGEASYTESFDAYVAQAAPPDWVESRPGTFTIEQESGANRIYVARPRSPKQRSVARGPASDLPEGGAWAILTKPAFSMVSGFELRGRVRRDDASSLFGLAVFSSLPESPDGRMVALWNRGDGLAMHVFRSSGGATVRAAGSSFAPEPQTWYRFAVRAVREGQTATIGVRMWREGEEEPSRWLIDAADDSASPDRGRIALWASGGSVSWDELSVTATATEDGDVAGPEIEFYETGDLLPPGSATSFNRDARIEIRAIDGSGVASVEAILGDVPYVPLTPIAVEARHRLTARATDTRGNVTQREIEVVVDKTPPAIVISDDGALLMPGLITNRNVKPVIATSDLTDVTVVATLDADPFVSGTAVSSERAHLLTVTAKDAVGWESVATVPFTIDRTPPAIRFTAPQEGSVVGSAETTVSGTSDDAIRIAVNGIDATLDAGAGTFTTAVALREGSNDLVAVGFDQAGNEGHAALRLTLDTRAPEMTVRAPLAGACVKGSVIDVRIVSRDASLVRVTVDGQSFDATRGAGEWIVRVPLREGTVEMLVEAIDEAGHASTRIVPVIVDRTAPLLAFRERGVALGSLYNRDVIPVVSTDDADTAVLAAVTLDGAPFGLGNVVSAEGEHLLRATAVDCAGNAAIPLEQRFTIDRTAPSLLTVIPASGDAVGALPASIQGTLSEPASVTDVASGVAAMGSTNAFTLALPFEEGRNERSLRLVDAAGNSAIVPYTLTVDTAAPTIEIVEQGLPIAHEALFNRAVAPRIRVSDPEATLVAELNGNAFVSGTELAADGTYELVATATDAAGHGSTARARFSIDRTPPRIDIVTPQDGIVLTDDAVAIEGSVDPDAVSVTLNGAVLPVSAGRFTGRALLEPGQNAITATATDAAGNASSDSVIVTRSHDRLAIVLTSPADGSLTNRPVTVVAGQVISPSRVASLTIDGNVVDVDPSGSFRRIDHPLDEGANAITAEVVAADGATNQVRTTVIADFTPPALAVTANGLPLDQGARFGAAPALEIEARDDRPGAVALTIFLDGEEATQPLASLPDGSHALHVLARDAAGNESRIARAFVIGSTEGEGGCAITAVEPPDGSAVRGEMVRISGRCAGARGVLIDGVAAEVRDGSFCGEARLREGRNDVAIRCADADGTPSGEPVILTLWRDAAPSITIASPADGLRAGASSIGVSGQVSEGVVSGDVNGIGFTIDPAVTREFHVPNVPLSPGVNVISVRARTGSGLLAVATTRVILLGGTPQLSITSPLPGTETGASSIEVRGTYANVDPDTIRVAGASATTTPSSDTSGTFAAQVTLPHGPLDIAVSGRNALGTEATARVTVQRVDGTPSIAITAPRDVHVPQTAASIAVEGTFDAPPGSQVTVNGVAATVSGNAFSATVPLTNSGVVPIVARLTTPDGAIALGTARIVKNVAGLAVRESYPPAGATGIDRGVSIVILFNNELEAASAAQAVRLRDSGGAEIDGRVYVDRDAIMFAPDSPLAPATAYIVTIAASLRDAADVNLSAPFELRFTTASTAASAAPQLDAIDDGRCTPELTLTGRAANPGAVIEVLAEGVRRETVASETGAFSLRLGFSGRPGFHLIRVREKASDGTLSPESAVCVRFSCETPRVLGAALDRDAGVLRIEFSRPMDPATLIVASDGAIVVEPENATPINGSVSMNATGEIAEVVVGPLPLDRAVSLTVRAGVKDRDGVAMADDFTKIFAAGGSEFESGKGVVSGGVIDATTGRPLAGATVMIAGESSVSGEDGRYARIVGEGAHLITISADGFADAWREVVVAAGASVTAIDVRLARRAAGVVASSGDLHLVDGATQVVELDVPAGVIVPGTPVHLTSISPQSLPGLLPLGWAPLAAAEIHGPSTLSGATLTFIVDSNEVARTSQTLSLVRYRPDENQWRVLVPVVSISADGRASVAIAESGSYALVYGDSAPHLSHPPVPGGGDALRGVASPCSDPAAPCELRSVRFDLEPRAIVPNGRAVATLVTEGATQVYPSGTAAQAFIHEELTLADGRTQLDPAFSTDVLLYRTLAGDEAVAAFHIAPSPAAARVLLRSGVERIRIVEYPGRVDRGGVIGAEGGRVPGDGGVTIDVPPGATLEPILATATTLSAEELGGAGSIAGFRIAGGFALEWTATTEVARVPELLLPASATVTVPNALLDGSSSQVVIARWIPASPFGVSFQLVAICDLSAVVGEVALYATRAIDSSQLPIEGLRAPGNYLVLVADAPIAFAYGTVRASGVGVAEARVYAGAGAALVGTLGVTSITNAAGTFALPVPASPAPPFGLSAESLEIGRGASRVAGTSPTPDSIVAFGDLPLAAQPPRLIAVTPSGGEVAIEAAFLVRAEFDTAIDPASVARGIVVVNETTGVELAGVITAAGNVVTFNAGEPLRAASRYSISVRGTIRALSGAPFGQLAVTEFTTADRPRGNTAFHPERIRITIPDDHGVSIISGAAGALPVASQAIAVRRGRAFVQQYQATVAVDGSFSFSAGAGDPRDGISVDDAIDLQVLDSVSRAIVAVFPLTPFSSSDGRGFIARPDREAHFVSADGIGVRVPAGAFERPTLVRIETAARERFATVPSFNDELRFAAGVTLTFDGVANERLQLSLPIPSGLDPAGGNWTLGYLGESVRGPRVMIVDLLSIQDGSFVTPTPSPTASARSPRSQSASSDIPALLLGIERAGAYAAVDLSLITGSAITWGILEGLSPSNDLFWSTARSLYIASFYVGRMGGRVAVPLPQNKAFELVGVDASTGLDAFTKAYDPIVSSDPGAAVVLGNPDRARTGPYPVFGTPFHIEMLDVTAERIPLESIRDLTFELANGVLTAQSTLASDLPVTLLNPGRGVIDRTRSDGIEVAASVGDRIAVMVGVRDVDPDTSLSLVFSEPLALENQTLPNFIRVAVARSPFTTFEDITALVRLRLDSGGRRVVIETGTLVRGARYRVGISPLLGNSDGLRIGQVRNEDGDVSAGLEEHLYLTFDVRAPAGVIATFELEDGTVRDQALNGNVLLVSAGSAGVLAFDTSDPVRLGVSPDGTAAKPKPLGRITMPAIDFHAVASDHHGRVYTTGVNALFGVVQSYRIEDLVPCLDAPGPCAASDGQARAARGAATISWVPGAASAMQLNEIPGGNRPEALPRRLQILLQDDEVSYEDRTEFKALTNATVTSSAGDFEELSVEFPRRDTPYATQRYTVENLTLDLRWSADATVDSPARIRGIIAREGDRLRVLSNRFTWGLVTLFGYGIGLYDLNAIESNDAPVRPPDDEVLEERIRVTRGAFATWCDAPQPERIPDLVFAPDAAIIPATGSPQLNVYAVDPRRGVLDLKFESEGAATQQPMAVCSERAPVGLVFRNTFERNGAYEDYDHPRLAKLRETFASLAGRQPFARYTATARYRWRLEAADNPELIAATAGTPAYGARGSVPNQTVERDYLLIPANEYGLLVAEVPKQGWLGPEHLVDVIWIPAGAYAVRVMPRSDLATVVDGRGHLLLIDLSRIDERWTAEGQIAADALFPTVTASLDGTAGAHGVGKDDPRIVWRSDEPLALIETLRDANGNPVSAVVSTLAPLVNPDTGFVFSGNVLTRTAHVVAAADPRIQMKADTGSSILREVSGVVPLGVAPPDQNPPILACNPATDETCNASLAAFRLELTLPGSIAETLPGQRLRLAIESERVAGAITEQTPDGFPRSHLRAATRDGVADPRAATGFTLERVIPHEYAPRLRHLGGFNRFVSPWVVAIADPRASEAWHWSGGKPDADCVACVRPAHLRAKNEGDGVWELFSNGRSLSVRLEMPDAIADSPYSWLSDDRLTARFATVMADTIRTHDVLVAAQNPPAADGVLQGTTWLHSGEVEASAVDLVAGGRAGWDVAFDRTYRSRTIGASPLGAGWDAAMFQRLRVLPGGNVEYRDGAGEVWLFRVDRTTGAYLRPKGLFVRLSRTARGWILVDQAKRFTAFDEMGRLVFESDEFTTDPWSQAAGNVIRYLYDREGRLAQIVDPVGRISRLTYFEDRDDIGRAGLVKSIEAWGARRLDFHYDAMRRLIAVDGPEVENTDGVRPRVRYEYANSGDSLNDRLEIATNLLTITEPAAEKPRVTFEYGFGVDRDKVVRQEWTATGEAATFRYDVLSTETTDALGQVRRYTFTPAPTDLESDRVHVQEFVEFQIETAAVPFGELPAGVTPLLERKLIDRRLKFTYHEEGMVRSVMLSGETPISTSIHEYRPAGPGWVLISTTTAPASSSAPIAANASSTGAITRQFDYVDDAFVSKVTVLSEGETRVMRQAVTHGRHLLDSVENDQITTTIEQDEQGRVIATKSAGGTDPGKSGSTARFTWHDDTTGPELQRGELATVRTGDLEQSISYGERSIRHTDERGVETTTELDATFRPTRVYTSSDEALRDDITIAYDARGRVRETRRRQGGITATEKTRYDDLGRVVETRSDNIAIGNALTETVVSRAFDLPSRKLVTTLPGGAVLTEHLDTLGRPRSRVLETGSSDIREEFAYDIAGNRVAFADNHTATASAFDVHGRLKETLNRDGTRTRFDFDPLGVLKAAQQLASDGALTTEMKTTITEAGRIESASTRVDAEVWRESEVRWDGAGRATAGATDGRAWSQNYDESGVLRASKVGAGSVSGIATPFATSEVTQVDGGLPTKTRRVEREGDPVDASFDYDAHANVAGQRVGSLQWQATFDEAGNVLEHRPPRRGHKTFEYDGRGSVLRETRVGVDPSTVERGYSAAGNEITYEDPLGEVTKAEQFDRIGRPLLVRYPDQTFETFTWDGPRLQSRRDRQGRIYHYEYDESGRVREIREGGGGAIEQFAYDAAGRLRAHRTADALLEYDQFDMQGRPRLTRQTRFADRSGFGGHVILDSFEQTHEWNVHGERVEWTMPRAVHAAPTQSDGWTTHVEEKRNAMGDVESIVRTIDSEVPRSFLRVDHRGPGRATEREVSLPDGKSLLRRYGYEGETGRVNEMSVSTGPVVVAGSHVQHDGLQIGSTTLLGVSGGARANRYLYDDFGRLASSSIAGEETAPSSWERLDKADFRHELDRPAGQPASLPSLDFAHEAGHKIGSVSRDGEQRTFVYDGAERVDDGRWQYQFDARGRLVSATEKDRGASSVRRVLYDYAGSDRIVGRRVEYADVGTDAWWLEDRPDILAADGLPAETTFIWDPISDRLVAIADRDGRTLRQIIHGEGGYDDPLEVAVLTTNGVERLYPIFDEAAAGILQAVVDERGDVVSRSVVEGAYGEDEFVLAGPAVDRISATAVRDDAGGLQSVTVLIRLTEALDPSTIAAGARLSAVDSDGLAVHTVGVHPTPNGTHTLGWTLSAEEWQTLLAPPDAASLSIGVTTTLRASAWPADTPVLPAPDWAVSLRSTASMPVEYREPLTTVREWFAGEKTEVSLFTAPALSSLASAPTISTRAITASPFQALPFAEPATGLTYARARWLDPKTGTFMTPDPMGYRDSSNVYAFAGGEPVGRRDPRGEYQADMHFHLTYYLALRAGFSPEKAMEIAEGAERPDQDERAPIRNGATMLLGVTLGERAEGSYNLWQWHFAKSDELKGEVAPGSREAREKAFSGLIHGNIREFSEGLHPFQDSWSHSGAPTMGSGGHPGGYFNKHGLWDASPDYTSTFPPKSREAAEETFRFLVNYRESFPMQAGQSPRAPSSWSSIRGEVMEYMLVDTIAEKQDWLRKHGAFIDKYWDDVTLDPSPTWRAMKNAAEAARAVALEQSRQRAVKENQWRGMGPK